MENISELLLFITFMAVLIFLIIAFMWLSVISKQNKESERVEKAIRAYYEKKKIKVRMIQELSIQYYLIVFEEQEVDEEILRIEKQWNKYQIIRSYLRAK